ncbi:hypothetical protein [[Limnothrix rosea] IAM M-220]|uniref:hypothetical protein n=1 Tax=[Limnothrix rosea] IAM M-220 TaxID=454133 RepID=UPI0009681E6D|nr:hypothetical protein [[Limnothrix rosea] IAM M-220]OKH16022.1 hypothetical protein NIES208_12185 [[Limnothrix rosea] IAM M-220]
MKFVLCLKNENYAASLEPRKIYQTIEDAQAQTKNFLRIIDESGKDYLYPANYFAPIQVPDSAISLFATS